MSFNQFIADCQARIEAKLEIVLPASKQIPENLHTAMRYAALGGGKRVRPMLSYATGEALNIPADRLDAPAVAIEIMHTFSLIHDDLPAMDNDTLRRGRPTLHVVAGEGMAILAGDGLLTEAFALLARAPETRDAAIVERKLRVIGRIASAAGPVGMVGGQALDLACSIADPGGRPQVPLDASDVRAMHAKKTGALIRASAIAGAIMGGGDDDTVDQIDTAATELGLAFQIVDDILDVEGVSAHLGKTAGKDAAAGKPTYPALYGLDAAKRMAAECLERAEGALRAAGLAESRLMEIGRWIVHRSN